MSIFGFSIFGRRKDKPLHTIREVDGYDIPGPGYQYQVEYEIRDRRTGEVVDRGRTRFYANPSKEDVAKALQHLRARWEESHAQV